MPAETMQQLLRERLEDDDVGVLYGDMSWTWRDHLADAMAFFIARYVPVQQPVTTP